MQESTAGKFHWRPPSPMHARNGRGRATRAWIDRTNDGLSGMPAEGTSACREKRGDFGTSRWAGLKVRYITTRLCGRGMTACGTNATNWHVRSRVLRILDPNGTLGG